MILSKPDIRDYCDKKKLVTPWKDERIEPSSYDLTFDGQYYYYQKSDGVAPRVQIVKDDEDLQIPADAICFVMTKETVTMPNNIAGQISLKLGLILKGVMLSNHPPIDPGYSGKIVGMLHNLSDRPVSIPKGSHILSIVFHQLSTSLEPKDAYHGKHQGLTQLRDCVNEVLRGSVARLAEDLKKSNSRFLSFFPSMMVLVTVIIAVLTIIVGIKALK